MTPLEISVINDHNEQLVKAIEERDYHKIDFIYHVRKRYLEYIDNCLINRINHFGTTGEWDKNIKD